MFHLILSVLLATFIGCTHIPDTTDPSRAQVVKVHDGDTIVRSPQSETVHKENFLAE